MYLLEHFGPALATMTLLSVASAFFSCSEAALFSLQPDDRRSLQAGSPPQRMAVQLLERPEQLLMAILFSNLLVNVLYFALSSVVSIRLQQEQRHAEAGLFAMGSLLVLILVGELVPKTVGVFAARLIATLFSLPLSLVVRLFVPLAPMFSAVNRALRRLLFPGFRVEPYLALDDLEQAIAVSVPSEELAARERTVLQNIVLLSELTAEELMRPRTQYTVYPAPVHLEHLGGQLPRSGYLLVSEPDSEEIVSAVGLKFLPTVPRRHVEHFAEPVVYVPWCASVAAVFDTLTAQDLEVAAVLNEFGETVGVITLEDLLQTVFEDSSSRSARLLATASIQQMEGQTWRVTGMTSLRRLSRSFDIEFPPCKSTTVAGIAQEVLQRLPEPGDEFQWFQFHFRVLELQSPRKMLLELQRLEAEGGQ